MKTPRVPSYRRHAFGQARVTLNGKDHLLGAYGSPKSQEAYRRLVAEWIERRGVFAQPTQDEQEPLTLNELLLAYWKHAESYYGWDKEVGRGDAYNLKDALRVVKALYGSMPAEDFGPLA